MDKMIFALRNLRAYCRRKNNNTPDHLRNRYQNTERCGYTGLVSSVLLGGHFERSPLCPSQTWCVFQLDKDIFFNLQTRNKYERSTEFIKPSHVNILSIGEYMQIIFLCVSIVLVMELSRILDISK